MAQTLISKKKGKEGEARVPRPSLIIEVPPEKDTLFLDLVSKGDLTRVRTLVESKGNVISINCLNIKGHSALHLALKNNDERMVAYLVSRKDLDPMDCVLHAVKMNHPRIVTMILDKLKSIHPVHNLEFNSCVNSPDFPDYLTPLMLAAQCGHVEMINLLLYRDHPPLVPPHAPSCQCEECIVMQKEKDPLELTNYKYDLYRAICNPVYVCQLTNDPILLVFHLVVELREVAKKNRILLRSYEELILKTETFAADLISQCRTSEEVKTILNEKYGSNLSGEFQFPRLILAVDYKQKHFVAQTNVQEVLESAWVSSWYAWRSYSQFRCFLHFLGRVSMLLVLFFVCLLFPKSKWAKFYETPLNRMLSWVASNFVFLFLLFIQSISDKKGQTRYDILDHTGWLTCIFLFELTRIISSARMCILQGVKKYSLFKWNQFDAITDLLFVTSFLFWLVSVLTCLREPDIERKNWDKYDSQLFFEGFLCVATVMSFSRLLLLLQIHETWGPMQVSLGKMTKDLFQFIIVFIIALGSFNIGMCRLYQYYDGMQQTDTATNAISSQESSFVSGFNTFKVLFWGLFGMSSQDSGAVVIENLPNEEGALDVIVTHDFTQAVGLSLFAIYTVLQVIMLLNMLVAVMSNSYQKVTDNVDVEWVFGRTEVYLSYMSQSVLPPPLNWVPAAVGHGACAGFIQSIIGRRLSDRESEDSQEEKREFDTVMQRLVQRYLSQKDEKE